MRAPRVPGRLSGQVQAAILHEDERLLVVNKPAGIAVHGGSGVSAGVIEALRAARPDQTLELVHRLDRDTSGCLLIARKRSTLRSLHALLREDSAGEGDGFDKRYLALVRGKWELGKKRIDAPLRTDTRVGGERTVKVDASGKEAASEFRVVQFFGNLATLLEVRLFTGRTHQIRVHAAYAGHPVAGDSKYGDGEFNRQLQDFGLRRLFLHAHSISFEDPDGRGLVSVSAPLPQELHAVSRFTGRRRGQAATGRAGCAPVSPANTCSDRHAQLAQGPAQPDQGQPHQRARVARLDRLEKGHAEALALEPAGTVEGRFAIDVAANLQVAEFAQVHGRQVHMGEFGAALYDGNAGVEPRGPPGHLGQLGMGMGAVARLVQQPHFRADPHRGHLVAADDDAGRVGGCHRPGLGQRQPGGARGGRLAGKLRLVNLRRLRSEGQPQPFQQCPAMGRSGGEDNGGAGGHGPQ